MKKKIMALFCTLFALSVITVGVGAVSTGGGTWNYGVGVTGSYSDYLHPTRVHTATVKRSDMKPSMARASYGEWAKARLTSWSGCQFFWNVE